MTAPAEFEIFLVATPGLETVLEEEAKSAGFKGAKSTLGGVTFIGSWPDVWRANLELRGAGRVLARIASFHATHLAQLDKRARNLPWAEYLRKDKPVRVEASCRKSKIYHSGAAAERIATAVREELGAAISDDAEITIMVRIENDLVTVSLDTSGDLLHKRGSKQAMAKAPMRETMASLFLRQCGYTGKQPVIDPLCGSGTFVIEAAEIAAKLKPGRNRNFAFEQFSNFKIAQWHRMKAAGILEPPLKFFGSDRDAGAVAAAQANAVRAGVSAFTQFTCKALTHAEPPQGPPGLVIMNPPYGARIGDKSKIRALYAAIGNTMREKFAGWHIAVIATDKNLVAAMALPLKTSGKPILHGGLRIQLWQSTPPKRLINN